MPHGLVLKRFGEESSHGMSRAMFSSLPQVSPLVPITSWKPKACLLCRERQMDDQRGSQIYSAIPPLPPAPLPGLFKLVQIPASQVRSCWEGFIK